MQIVFVVSITSNANATDPLSPHNSTGSHTGANAEVASGSPEIVLVVLLMLVVTFVLRRLNLVAQMILLLLSPAVQLVLVALVWLALLVALVRAFMHYSPYRIRLQIIIIFELLK